MKNTLIIDGEKATLTFDPDINLFRGEFIGLNGGADFYADSVEKLIEEGRKSLARFMQVCMEENIEPRRHFSGRFNIRLDPQIHAAAAHAASAHHMSLNEWIATTITEAVQPH